MQRLQDRYWAGDRLGGPLRIERHYDGRSMRCFSERPATIPAMFATLLERLPDRPAIVEDRRLSYCELHELVESIAAGLARYGISAGDRVVLFLGNRWQFLATVLACTRIGAVAVPIGTRQRANELEFMINDCAAKIVIHEAELADEIPPAASIATVTHLFAIGGEAPGSQPFDALLAGPDTAPAAPPASEEDAAVILYTSGTTGRPKGAILTHLSIIHSSLTFARCHGLTEEDRCIVAVPLSHVTGLVGVSFATMIVGGCVVLMRQAYKTPDFLALAARERITYSILVPAIYTLCALYPDLDQHDLSQWRIGCFGGAPMPVPTIEMLARRLPHLLLLNAYGATETTSPTTCMPRGCWRENMDSVGQVVPCGEVVVRDETGKPVPPGTPGELWIAGPMVVPGYFNRPEANANEFVDGFWRSGDIGSVDAEGFVRIFDRRKDMINRGGYKVYSAEVENILTGLEGVQECAVIGIPDPVLGERVHVFVKPRDNALLTPDTVRSYCGERMADYKVPETVTFLSDPLPRNANGKIQKAVLRAMDRG
ncbi:MAG TPA: class I adenylate-forming enzyme family protein [Hypericibacter adhaerens]|uniref:class I adenylate-forming enzyme family protein n=1 Tax=Hypericibacter adhaerens TaxID=2602016 RepID=UPI002C5EBE2A|nr:class I adenylate-forming enzyme family protein [Hypericibacter adhaerens]HWA46163.1 class I adenylate-forming enzyme family protein [Hypericibacter adhaerens]